MTFLEKIQVIERIDCLIRRKSTGTATELAERLGVSRSTVFTIMDCMKAMGAEIEFNPTRRSYHYTVQKKLAIGFVDTHQIKGGSRSNNFSQSDFFRLQAFRFTSGTEIIR